MTTKIDPEKLQRELAAMREMIDSDPWVRTRFDTNGDGQIDGAEWEAVRQMVVQRLESEAAEAHHARAVIERDAAAAAARAEVTESVYVEEVLPYLAGESISKGPFRAMIEYPTLILQSVQARQRPSERESVLRNHHQEEVGRVMLSWSARAVRLDITDEISGDRVEIYGNQKGEPLVVLANGREVASTRWQAGEGRGSYEIFAGSGHASARHLPDDDCVYDVHVDGTPSARVHDNWMGPGIWTYDGNAVRISLHPELPHDLRWGVLATAALIDIQRIVVEERMGDGSGGIDEIASVFDLFEAIILNSG